MEPGIMTTLGCIPCFVRQALETARLSTVDPEVHERIVRETLLVIADMDMKKVPPVISQQIHRHLRKLTGVDDPYLAAKDRFNRMALEMLPEIEARLAKAPDPFGMATRLAIAGNVIDLGAKADLKRMMPVLRWQGPWKNLSTETLMPSAGRLRAPNGFFTWETTRARLSSTGFL